MQLLLGDCVEVLKTLEDNSVDAVVTDPPYALGFMGKEWDTFDNSQFGISGSEGKNDLKVKKSFNILPRYTAKNNQFYEFSLEWAREVYRVLKPGGHLLSFGGTRTYHRMACAIEDAGFEIRDQIQWLYAQGFPKSYNIGKGINAKQRVGTCQPQALRKARMGDDYEPTGQEDYRKGRAFESLPNDNHTEILTDTAQQWDGWGSALKPANEPVCLARKPLSEKTIVENVLKWGTGGINVDGCRIAHQSKADYDESTKKNQHADFGTKPMTGNVVYGDYSMIQPKNYKPTSGRFPANIILDEEAGRLLDEQSGERAGCKPHYVKASDDAIANAKSKGWGTITQPDKFAGFNDKGGASRFFYCAKSSRKERNAGLEGMPDVDGGHYRQDEWSRNNMGNKPDAEREPVKNGHPTVKPISLMRYLCRLITPPNGIVLDPFMGSGTTGCAAVLEGFDFIGIEQDAEYIEIAKRRIEYWGKDGH